jgi:osmotically-inducible protein OsmY
MDQTQPYPQPEHRSDAELQKAVIDELTWTPSVDSTHIGVSVNRGGVTLSGEVESYPEKLLAEKAALRVRGVTAIAEQITVRTNWGAPNDTDIARDATHALEHAIDVPPDLVKVAVHEHVISLSGAVPWQFQREAAGRAVRYLKGVTGVSNNVTIRPSVSAVGIKTAISAAFVRSAQLDGKRTTVSADEAGAVTLDGQVQSWAERRHAEHAAWAAPGVTAVINHLSIGY